MAAHPVLLDIDGTLLDSNDAHAASWSDAFHAYGYRIPKGEVRPMIGMGGDKIMATLVPGLAPDDGRLGQKITERRARIFLADYLPGLKPTRGARELLRNLIERGCTLVVATSAKGDELNKLLRQAEIADLIEHAATSDDAEESKPDPDIIEAALRKAKSPASAAVMIGDTPYDIISANRAGVRIIAVRCGGWREPDMSAAEAVYDDPADILAHMDAEPLTRLFPSMRGSVSAPH